MARLAGLARTQALLTDSARTGAALRDLLQAELAIHGSDSSRISLSGPSMIIPASQAVALGMMFHELTTNAAKYGSLSVPGGSLRVSWSVTDAEGGGKLTLTWEESGGPPVTPPTRSGFGTQMIQRGLTRQLGAVIEANYEPGGLVFRLAMPLIPDIQSVEPAVLWGEADGAGGGRPVVARG